MAVAVVVAVTVVVGLAADGREHERPVADGAPDRDVVVSGDVALRVADPVGRERRPSSASVPPFCVVTTPTPTRTTDARTATATRTPFEFAVDMTRNHPIQVLPRQSGRDWNKRLHSATADVPERDGWPTIRQDALGGTVHGGTPGGTVYGARLPDQPAGEPSANRLP
ncbi:hypothetical protein [Halorussus caseinilyticus]|uniref:Uncharacterized protein n=1 Tax=Halorussus caseinilyticus TaxID=3034025 RepID=A0ABD5WM86_9EURY